MAPNVASRYWMLRPVMAGKVGLAELRTLTLCDVADWHEILDVQEEAEARALAAAEKPAT